MVTDSDVESIVSEVMEQYNQSDAVENRFLRFYENTLDNNLGRDDLQKLIDTIELTEEEKLDGS